MLAAATDSTAILELLPHGVVLVASDWRVIFANPEATRLLGATGATLWERCPDLEHTAFASGFRYAMSDRSELLTESALPSVGWCQARALPTQDGGLLLSLRQMHGHTIESGQAKQALLIGEIGDALTREDSLSASLQRCAVSMTRHLDAAVARIWVADAGGDYLELAAHAGLDVPDLQARIAFGHGKIGDIAESAEPYLTNEVTTDPKLDASEWARVARIHSFAGYPLRVEDRIVGVMAMFSRRSLDHDMLNSLSTIADAISLGVARKTADAARRRAEHKLRTQAERLERLYELSQQVAGELDVKALAEKVIATASALTGARGGAFVWRPPGSAADDAPALGVVTGAALGAPRRLPRFEGVVRVDDLHAHPRAEEFASMLPLTPESGSLASFLAIPVPGRNGVQLGALLLGHDHTGVFTVETERLLASVANTAAIAMDNARLFAEARELIAALEKSNSELDQFAYVASHDLKAPLRGIANLSQWIEDDLGEVMSPQTREHMQLLRGRVLRLENLIGGILAYSRAGRERDPKAVDVDMTSLAREVWELLAPPQTATIEIGELPHVSGVRAQLQQVLLNLMSNAIKYNPDRALHVRVSAERDKDRWVFAIKDDGVGIAPEFHERIWGLFQTLERRDKVESTGIGLSVVRKIVESHRGNAWVESQPGSGATFYFTWPAEVEGAKRHG
ncbi:MAG: ATP-binding protein [Kofleriaceae bacterium]